MVNLLYKNKLTNAVLIQIQKTNSFGGIKLCGCKEFLLILSDKKRHSRTIVRQTVPQDSRNEENVTLILTTQGLS